MTSFQKSVVIRFRLCYPINNRFKENYNITTTAEIMNKGMKCLIEQMGIVEAEQFISLIIREKFDYTKWQREYFDAKTPSDISNEAFQFETSHPFTQNVIRL